MVDGNALLSGESAAAAVENAAERQFGPEFEDIHILSNAQVAVILQVSAQSAVNRDEELNEVYRKTQKYVERFNTMTNPEKITRQGRSLLDRRSFLGVAGLSTSGLALTSLLNQDGLLAKEPSAAGGVEPIRPVIDA